MWTRWLMAIQGLYTSLERWTRTTGW